MDLTGLKVMFINMPLRESALPNNLPMGPALLAARLRQHGAIPIIVDLNAYRPHLTPDETETLLRKYLEKHGDQDLIGLSGLITTLRWQEEVAKIIRKLQPETFLVSGGGLATELKTNLYALVPELDAVVSGEGDNIILEIASNVKRNKAKYFYQGKPVLNLDDLPLPAYDLLEHLEYYLGNPIWGGNANNSSATTFTMERSINTVSSRGCPFDCKYCYRGQQGGRNYRARSAESLIREVVFYEENYNVDFVGFVDDNFMVDPKRISQLSHFGVNWGTHGRLDEADERVESMAKAGCVYIGFGGESASATILDSMGKGGRILANGLMWIGDYLFPRIMVEGIQRTIEYGIHPNCTWMMGWPGETLQDLQATVAFIEWQESICSPESVNKSIFVVTAYPETELFLNPIVQEKIRTNFLSDYDYILQLGDATKFIPGMNFSAMPDEVFCQARDYIDSGQIFKILDM